MRTNKDELEQRGKTCAEVLARPEATDGLDMWHCEFLTNLITDVEDAVGLLKEYELWEAALILDNGAWRSEPPVLTEALQDSFIALQTKRNDFLKEPSNG